VLPGYRRLFDHLPVRSVEFRNVNMCSYTSTPPYIVMALCLVKYGIRLHGAALNQAHGQLYVYLLVLLMRCIVAYWSNRFGKPKGRDYSEDL